MDALILPFLFLLGSASIPWLMDVTVFLQASSQRQSGSVVVQIANTTIREKVNVHLNVSAENIVNMTVAIPKVL